jgi:class 3 adenylate cyclase
VFDAILQRAQTLCDAAYGSLMLYDGESFRAAAVYFVSEAFAERLREGFRVVDTPFAQRLLDGAGFVHVPDFAEVDHQIARAAVELTGVRTRLVVPLRKDDVLLGAISTVRREVWPFSDKQIALLQNFAAQAAIAMENARLLTETREALEQQTATADVLGVINSSPGELVPVFEAMLDKAIRLCEATHGHMFTYDGERFHPAAIRSGPLYVEWTSQIGPILPYSSTPLGQITRGERIVHTVDVQEEDFYRTAPNFRQSVDIRRVRSQIAVALLKDDVLLGAMVVYRQEVRPFSGKQIALLQNFAAQAVIAMENARLLGELRQRTEELAELNRGLEARVAEQVDELSRVGRLKRFLAPQLAELIVSQGDEKILESHRREIVVVFCDLRGYTAFTETAEPEEVLDFLREYHGALGPLVSQFEGTLDQFSGDGIMVFFNDPVPCPDPAERAVKMAMAMREEVGKLITTWRSDGCELGFGAGIAQGYATLGQIGFSERSGYTAIGTVCNLAARLCAEANDGQILISSRVARAVEAIARLEDLGNLELKGLRRPVAAFNVV